jgi:hypothetical protein
MFRNEHAQCAEQHAVATAKIPGFFASALTSQIEPTRFHELVVEVAKTHHLKDVELRALVLKGFTTLIDSALVEGVLPVANEERIQKIRCSFGLSVPDLGEVGNKLIKAAILSDLATGVIQSRVNVQGELSVILEHDELVLWIFNKVAYQKFNPRTYEYDFLGGGDLIITDRNVFFDSLERMRKFPSRKSWLSKLLTMPFTSPVPPRMLSLRFSL